MLVGFYFANHPPCARVHSFSSLNTVIMIGFLIFLFGLLVTIGMCGLAAWSDFKGFRIPNIVSIVIIIAFWVAFGVTTLTDQRDIIFMAMPSHIGSAALVFMVTMAMFALKMFGAGDSKFATAVAFWLGFPSLAPFIFYMTLLGGVIAAISLALKKWKPFKNPPQGGWIAKAQEGHNSVPYGIAIAGGAIIAFIYQGYFSFATWGEMFAS